MSNLYQKWSSLEQVKEKWRWHLKTDMDIQRCALHQYYCPTAPLWPCRNLIYHLGHSFYQTASAVRLQLPPLFLHMPPSCSSLPHPPNAICWAGGSYSFSLSFLCLMLPSCNTFTACTANELITALLLEQPSLLAHRLPLAPGVLHWKGYCSTVPWQVQSSSHFGHGHKEQCWETCLLTHAPTCPGNHLASVSHSLIYIPHIGREKCQDNCSSCVSPSSSSQDASSAASGSGKLSLPSPHPLDLKLGFSKHHNMSAIIWHRAPSLWISFENPNQN